LWRIRTGLTVRVIAMGDRSPRIEFGGSNPSSATSIPHPHLAVDYFSFAAWRVSPGNCRDPAAYLHWLPDGSHAGAYSVFT
jgi:hypothetical protein